jgi:lipopolysaccharide export LptBFGC system permease protein LptF
LGRVLKPGANARARLAKPHDRRDLARNYYVRWGLAFSPLVLSLFALSLCVTRRARAATTMTLVCVFYIGYYFVTPALKTYLAPVALGWLPNIAVMGAAIVVMTLPGVPIPDPNESQIPNLESRST